MPERVHLPGASELQNSFIDDESRKLLEDTHLVIDRDRLVLFDVIGQGQSPLIGCTEYTLITYLHFIYNSGVCFLCFSCLFLVCHSGTPIVTRFCEYTVFDSLLPNSSSIQQMAPLVLLGSLTIHCVAPPILLGSLIVQ